MNKAPGVGRGLTRVLALILFSATVIDCTCGDVPLKMALTGTDFVFSATVIGRALPAPVRFKRDDGTEVKLNVGMVGWRMVASRAWKGQVPETLTVYSDMYAPSCGYIFELGDDYLVFARAVGHQGNRVDGGWPEGVTFPAVVTDACTKTRHLKSARSILLDLGEPIWVRGEPDKG